MVNLYIGNTDNDWFDFLAAEQELTEVNFWQPSEKAFHRIQPGELFAFRLKSPRNKIGGFGVLSSASILPLQMAWEAFGRSNGVSSYDELRIAIQRYRRNEVVGPATNIGCRILLEPIFFPSDMWFGLPASWSPNIVEGKGYSTNDPEGLALWNRLQDIAHELPYENPFEISDAGVRYGEPTLITPRLGQGAFRVAVTEAYNRQCAVTGGKVLPALDAAHIRPYSEGGQHTKSNGILLRKDIHCVFDAGYATIDTNFHFVVSSKVKEVFNNGDEYRRLHGKALRLPKRSLDRPDPQFLRWHNDNRFLG